MRCPALQRRGSGPPPSIWGFSPASDSGLKARPEKGSQGLGYPHAEAWGNA
jgi:hypothetical protein